MDADYSIKALADSRDDGEGKSSAAAMFEELGLETGGVNALRRKSSLIRMARRQVREADEEFKKLVYERERTRPGHGVTDLYATCQRTFA